MSKMKIPKDFCENFFHLFQKGEKMEKICKICKKGNHNFQNSNHCCNLLRYLRHIGCRPVFRVYAVRSGFLSIILTAYMVTEVAVENNNNQTTCKREQGKPN